MKKQCVACKVVKNLEDFVKDSSRKDGHRSDCKVCNREKQRSNWSSKYADKYKAKRQQDRNDRRELIVELKAGGCSRCPEKSLVCLDFHHVDDTEKDYGISQMLSFSRKRIIQEVEKCIVLCSNCHRKEHRQIKLTGRGEAV